MRRARPRLRRAEGIAGWLLAKQAEFYRMLSGTIRAAKTDGSAVWLLMGISFAYGVFHAAGPGHGKAVISSYLVANEETWKRGITLSFASALLQALVAVAVVGIAAALLDATAGTMNSAVWWIEIVSYALIAAMGARLLWVKGRAFWREFAAMRAPKSVGAAATHAHHHDHGHDHQGTTITAMRTTITVMRTITAAMPITTTTTIPAIRTGRRRTNSPVPAAGSAG